MRSLFLLVALVSSLCACAPVRFVMPVPTLAGGGAFPSPWGAVGLVIEQITPENLEKRAGFAVRVVHKQSGKQALLSRVPLPAFALQIRNLDARPLRLAGATAWLTDRVGQRYELLRDRDEIARRAIAQAIQAQPELTVGWIQADQRDPLAPMPLEALRAGSHALPILGEDVEIQPGRSWQGALVVAADADSIETLRRTIESGGVVLHVDGARVADQPLPPLALAFSVGLDRQSTVRCGDGRIVTHPDACEPQNLLVPVPDGSCLQEGERSRRGGVVRAAFIGGRRVPSSEISLALLDRPESRELEARSRALNTAGWVFAGGGTFGSAGLAAGLGASGHSKNAPAAVGMLGLTAIGVGLLVAGKRQHQTALRKYNAFAFESGICALPR